MRRASPLLLVGLMVVAAAVGCDAPSAAPPAASRDHARIRAERRAFDGAPPVIPHGAFGVACTSCHGAVGMEIAGVGPAPPNPHQATPGLSAASRCQQCHVERQTVALFAASGFTGLRQDLRPGRRLHAWAPPVIPHQTLLRENCAACHSGPAAREEIRCTHPERVRCQQCHLTQVLAEGELVRP